jgi:hypothetical protein
LFPFFHFCNYAGAPWQRLQMINTYSNTVSLEHP